MSNLRHFLGRTWYQLFHVPAGHLKRTFEGGGPWEQRRTEQGRREMDAAAFKLREPPVSEDSLNSALELHLLTGSRFWAQSAFCLYSFSFHAARRVAPIIYDDGTLAAEQRDALQRLFPLARFVAQAESLAKIDRLLPRARFPFLRERWEHYPNIRKLIDPHLGSEGWKLVIDSDLLFFRRPEFLVRWLDSPLVPLHAVDVETSYGYSPSLLKSLTDQPIAERLNVGLCGLQSQSLDWDYLEMLCRTLIEKERTHYYLEQALVALFLAGKACAIAPGSDYVTMPAPPEVATCEAVMHHYVADSKRWYFQRNWRRFAAA